MFGDSGLIGTQNGFAQTDRVGCPTTVGPGTAEDPNVPLLHITPYRHLGSGIAGDSTDLCLICFRSRLGYLIQISLSHFLMHEHRSVSAGRKKKGENQPIRFRCLKIIMWLFIIGSESKASSAAKCLGCLLSFSLSSKTGPRIRRVTVI